MATDHGDGTVKEPLNREPDAQNLVSHFLTPAHPSEQQSNVGYDRNHGPIPHLSASDHTVTISVPGGAADTKLSIHDLQTKFKSHRVTCALQCAGNRRHAMRTQLKEVQGIDWSDAAILNAEWEGPRLRDVLKWAGVQDPGPPKHTGGDTGGEVEHNSADKEEGKVNGGGEMHVQMACYQTEVQDDTWYGGSIPLWRAMAEEMEVVLALKMNGDTLTPQHGFPVRAVVPGIIGARSVKWLDRILLSLRESPNFYQQRDYKILPPDATDKDSAEKYWSTLPAMMDNPINAVVAIPEDHETAHLSSAEKLHVKGYAVPGGAGGPVVKVEVAVARPGETGDDVRWVEARLGPATRWSWVLWEGEVWAERGEGMRVFCRATDQAGNTQAEMRSAWNLRGVGYNGFESTVGLRIV